MFGENGYPGTNNIYLNAPLVLIFYGIALLVNEVGLVDVPTAALPLLAFLLALAMLALLVDGPMTVASRGVSLSVDDILGVDSLGVVPLDDALSSDSCLSSIPIFFKNFASVP